MPSAIVPMAPRNQPPPPKSPSPSPDPDDDVLSDAQFLTAEETIRRRHRRLVQLSRVYKDYYWALMAELRNKYRDYVWNFGTPFDPASDDLGSDLLLIENGGGGGGGTGISTSNKGKIEEEEKFKRCAHSHMCTRKAMAMTQFCHSHILSDPRQVLYKGCAYVTSKRGSLVQTLCAKPILRSARPSFCNYHLVRAKKSVARSLKQAGLTTSDSNRMAPLIHVIGAEFVHEILRKRRAVKEESKGNWVKMEEQAE